MDSKYIERNKIPHPIIKYEDKNSNIIIFSWDIVDHTKQINMFNMYGYEYDHFWFYKLAYRKYQKYFFNKDEYIIDNIKRKIMMYEKIYNKKNIYFFLQNTYPSIRNQIQIHNLNGNINIYDDQYHKNNVIEHNDIIYVNTYFDYTCSEIDIKKKLVAFCQNNANQKKTIFIGNFNRDIRNYIYNNNQCNLIVNKDYRVKGINANPINGSRFMSHVIESSGYQT